MELKKELFNYIIFGILTSIINIATYLFLTSFCHVNYIISNIIAWVLSVIFAYITNRTLVFESENNDILKEIFLFYSSRIFTVIIDTGLMIIFIDFLNLENTFSKLVVTMIVVILNYLFSKIIVFNDNI